MACEPICCRDSRGGLRQFPTCDAGGAPINYFIDPCASIGARVKCPTTTGQQPQAPTGCTYAWMCLSEWASMRNRPGKVADRFCTGARPQGCEGNQTVCTVECRSQSSRYKPPLPNRSTRPALPQFPQQGTQRRVQQPLIGRTLPFPFYRPRQNVG